MRSISLNADRQLYVFMDDIPASISAAAAPSRFELTDDVLTPVWRFQHAHSGALGQAYRLVACDENSWPLIASSSGGTSDGCVRRIQASLGASVDVQPACQACGVFDRRRQESEMQVVRGECGGRHHAGSPSFRPLMKPIGWSRPNRPTTTPSSCSRRCRRKRGRQVRLSRNAS